MTVLGNYPFWTPEISRWVAIVVMIIPRDAAVPVHLTVFSKGFAGTLKDSNERSLIIRNKETLRNDSLVN